MSKPTLTATQRYWLLGLVGLALALRLVWVLVVDPSPTFGGGDGGFYLHISDQLAHGSGLRYHGEPVAVVGPVYPLYLASLQWLAGPENVVLLARIGQTLIGGLLVAVMFAIGYRWHGATGGLVGAALLAIDLRFVVEVGSISTETLLIAILLLSLWLYGVALEKQKVGWWLLTGVMLGVLTLTRAVAQFLPAALMLHLWLLRSGRKVWRQWALMAGGFALIVCPWIVRNWVYFGHPKIGEGGAAHFWMGTRGDGKAIGYGQMLEDVEPLRVGKGGADRYNYIDSALATILAQPTQYMGLRLGRLLEAHLQPFGTVALGGVLGDESIKAAILAADTQTVQDLAAFPAFWPKLWIYITHFGSIGLALLYMVMHWRNWQRWLLLALVIGYFSGVYAFLTIIPRYLFPIMPLYLLLAAGALLDCRSWISDFRFATRPGAQLRSPQSQIPNS